MRQKNVNKQEGCRTFGETLHEALMICQLFPQAPAIYKSSTKYHKTVIIPYLLIRFQPFWIIKAFPNSKSGQISGSNPIRIVITEN